MTPAPPPAWIVYLEIRLMRNQFTAIYERDGDWVIGYCPEVPGANGQGQTVEECRQNLAAAVELILRDRREDALRGVPELSR